MLTGHIGKALWLGREKNIIIRMWLPTGLFVRKQDGVDGGFADAWFGREDEALSMMHYGTGMEHEHTKLR